MPNASPARATAKTTVGNQRHAVSQSLPHNRGSWREHFLHPRAAFWPFVADHDHFPSFDFAAQNANERGVLRFVDTGCAGEFHHWRTYTANFHNRAIGSQIAKEDCQTTLLRMRIFATVNDFFIFNVVAFNRFAERCPADGDAVKVQNLASALNFVQNGGDTACAMHIFHVPTP